MIHAAKHDLYHGFSQLRQRSPHVGREYRTKLVDGLQSHRILPRVKKFNHCAKFLVQGEA